MAISISVKNSGIPDCVFQGIEELGHEAEFKGDWRVSVVTGDNVFWRLRLESTEAKAHPRDLEPEHQSVEGIRKALRAMRDSVG